MPVQWSFFTHTHIQLELPLRWCVKLWRPFLPERDSTLTLITSVAATPAFVFADELFFLTVSTLWDFCAFLLHVFVHLCVQNNNGSWFRETPLELHFLHQENSKKSTSVEMTQKLHEKDFICACTVYSETPKCWGAENKLNNLFFLLSSSLTITNPKFYSDDRNFCFSQLMAQEWNDLRFLFCSFSMEFRIRSVIKVNQSRDGWRIINGAGADVTPGWAAVFSMQLLTKALGPALKSDSPLGPSAGKKGFSNVLQYSCLLKAQQVSSCFGV